MAAARVEADSLKTQLREAMDWIHQANKHMIIVEAARVEAVDTSDSLKTQLREATDSIERADKYVKKVEKRLKKVDAARIEADLALTASRKSRDRQKRRLEALEALEAARVEANTSRAQLDATYSEILSTLGKSDDEWRHLQWRLRTHQYIMTFQATLGERYAKKFPNDFPEPPKLADLYNKLLVPYHDSEWKTRTTWLATTLGLTVPILIALLSLTSMGHPLGLPDVSVTISCKDFEEIIFSQKLEGQKKAMKALVAIFIEWFRVPDNPSMMTFMCIQSK